MIRRILQTSKPLRGTGLWAAGWTAITLAVAMPAQAEMKVVVSSKPAHALVALVMANVAVPTVLVAGSTSPHTYSLRPSDARKVNDANVFFRIGEGLEPFTAKLVKSLPATVKVVSLIDAPKLTVLDRRETGAFESHDHGHSAESKASAKGAPEPEDERDPHIWLDPDNAIAMIDHIAAVLGNLEPANAAAFKANAEMAKSQITALKADLEAQLKLVAAKPFVVLHDAYQYLENRFGLTAVGSIAVKLTARRKKNEARASRGERDIRRACPRNNARNNARDNT